MADGLSLSLVLRQSQFTAAIGDDFTPSIPLHRVCSCRRNIGARAVTRLPAFLDALSMQAAIRRRLLRSIPRIAVIGDAEGPRGTWPFYMVMMPQTEVRDAALHQL